MSSGGALDAQYRDSALLLGFTLHAETVTYTAVGGPGVAPVGSAISAVRVATPDVLEGDTEEKTKWVVRAADVAAPKLRDRITDDGGFVWCVIRITPQLGGQFELTTLGLQEG
jgi:hypothetical protein